MNEHTGSAPSSDRACPLCGATLHTVLQLSDEPALANRLWPDRASARSAPSGDVDLAFCGGCGVGHNRAFDPSVVAYDGDYENALHHSATFSRYAERLADDLVSRHQLGGRRLLEVGSGSGDFLRRLVTHAGPGTTAIGFDPGAVATSEEDGLRFVNRLEPERIQADFVCTRHVLEHLVDPLGSLIDLRQATPGDGSMTLYVEVPDGGHMLRTTGIWDVIYEHPWYYTEPALERLLGRAGFEVTATGSAYDGQYLWMEAVSRGDRPETAVATGHDGLGEGADLGPARRFADRSRDLMQWWSDEVGRRGQGGVAVWGIGSKGVTFLNRVADPHLITHAIDLNPRKHGRHVPGTGHEVVSPDALTERPPATVLLMNGIYRDEVASQLTALGSLAELIVVDDVVGASAA